MGLGPPRRPYTAKSNFNSIAAAVLVNNVTFEARLLNARGQNLPGSFFFGHCGAALAI